MSQHILFWRNFNSAEANARYAPNSMSDVEKRAVERVLRARVQAPISDITAFIRSVSPEAILTSSLRDIRAVAEAF